MKIDFRDIQGFVPRGYRCPMTRYLLVRFGDAGPARQFLQRMIPRITTADKPLATQNEPLWNLALTAGGLRATGMDAAVLAQFEAAFVDGPDAVALGAFGESQPPTWWEGRFSSGDIHALVQIGAWGDQDLADATGVVRQDFTQCGITELMYRTDGRTLDARSLGKGKLHFGYTDGISHPDVRWGDDGEAQGTVDFRNFLLGYPNPVYPSAPPPILRKTSSVAALTPSSR